MNDLDHKPGPRPAASYALLYPGLAGIARGLGYALTLHGSMNRDMDLVAIPWIEEAASAEELAAAICKAVDGFTEWDTHPGFQKPHGRRCWLIWFKGIDIVLGGNAYIDLSVMPRTCDLERGK